jgi:hypothetical protein
MGGPHIGMIWYSVGVHIIPSLGSENIYRECIISVENPID